MDEINKISLSEQTKFRLDEISKIENYFIKEINQRISYSQKLSKLKVLIMQFKILSATSGGISIISFASAIGAPIGIVSASFTLIFSLATGLAKKLLDRTRKKRKKNIQFLCQLKVNSIVLIH